MCEMLRIVETTAYLIEGDMKASDTSSVTVWVSIVTPKNKDISGP